MIISFSVENYRSFAEEQTLSLVASGRYRGSHDNHLLKLPASDESVLRTGVIYGANGAGKSNLFRALSFLKSLVVRPKTKGSGTDREIFRFSDEYLNQPTSLTLRFLMEGRIFEFGVKLNDEYILEEWLIELDGKREKSVYERVTGPDGKVRVIGDGLSGEKLEALVLVGGRPEQTFLATIRSTLDVTDYGRTLGPVIVWFEENLRLLTPDANYRGLGVHLTKDQGFLDFASAFLRGASTGVERLDAKQKEITEDELRSILPEKTVERILNDARTAGVAVFRRGDQTEVLLERGEQNRYFTISIGAMHATDSGDEIPLEIAEESDGTRRLLHLLPALYHLNEGGGVFFIDEIDRSMHPLLVWKFLEYFLASCSKDRGQIIVTTHECNLLDHQLLRRDEVWFVEKKKSGASTLYSLSEFSPRNDLKLHRHYLQGRFGAVPFLGNLERLVSQARDPEK